ncbi:MAG TPA: DUF4962 domain-containing protein [Candidatus Hydrogenedentes bacterium]|nr:DUF4962 domain-containing protein [Candidatus Hydrogenedentota bacterium]
MKSKRIVQFAWMAVSISIAFSSIAAPMLDESPAQTGEWGFRPDDGASPVNPPGFSWRPCKDADHYVLEIAQDSEFKNSVLSEASIPWSAYCPSKKLNAGTYFWRYCAVDAAGETSEWSHIRTFSISGDAVVFPQLTRQELKQRMPAEHPRLFFRPEDLPRLREQAQGPLAERWTKLLQAADKLLVTPPDTTDPPKYPKTVDRRKTPGEWKKIWWGNRARVIAVADSAATLGFVYRISGEEKYAKAARDLLLAATKWDLNGGTNYRYNDEAAMPMLYMAARAYSWCYPVLSESDRAAIAAMMRERGSQAYKHLRANKHLWHPYNSHSNRAWHFLGETAIAFYDEIPEAPEWLDYAMTIFYTAYPVWGDDDGGWQEGMAYWNSYLSLFMYWASIMSSAFDIDVYQKPFFRHAGDFAMYTMPPGTGAGAFGDLAEGSSAGRVAPLMLFLANGSRNPYWKWYADACGAKPGDGYLGFLYAGQLSGLESKAPEDLPTSRCFHGTGLAAMNTNLLDGKNNIQVHFKSSPFGRQSHGYNSNNAFLLNINGQRAFIQSGKRDLYGSEHHKNWMWETKSDNAILVNGEGQIPHVSTAKGSITVFETSPAVDVVVGEAAESYKDLKRWTRRMVFFKPNTILIHDLLDAPEPATFDWLLHGTGPFTIEGQESHWEGNAGKARIQFLDPAGLALSQTDVMDPPPGDYAKFSLKEWHLTARTGEKAQHQEFLVLITLQDVDVSIKQEEGNPSRLQMTLPNGIANVSLEPDHFSIDAPGFKKMF